MSQKIPLYYSLPVIILSTLLVAAVIWAWTEPTVAPPGGNVPAPINVGGDSQYKSGALGVGGTMRAYSSLINTGNSTNPVGGVCPSGTNWYDDGDGIIENGECYITSLYTLMNGRVGIGTTMPGAKLDVGGGGAIFTTGHTTGSAYMELGQGRTGTGYSYIDFHGDTTYTDYGLRMIRYNTGADAESRIHHRGTGILRLYTQEAGSHIVLQPGGNVGIGTTEPGTYKLRVVGTGQFTGQLDMSGQQITSVSTPVAGTDAVNKDYVDAQAGGGGACYTNYGGLTCYTGYVAVLSGYTTLYYNLNSIGGGNDTQSGSLVCSSITHTGSFSINLHFRGTSKGGDYRTLDNERCAICCK